MKAKEKILVNSDLKISEGKANEKPMTDEEATPLDWFFVEVFSKMILGDRHEIKKQC